MCLLKLTNLSFRYAPTEPWVFQDLSLELQEGQCLIVEGDNGSGKSTLFRILTGLSFAQHGRYCFDGIEINAQYLAQNAKSKLFHKRIGYLFQNPDAMLFNNNVYAEIAFGPRQLGIAEREVDKIVEDCLELFGLGELREKAPYHLSGGQKKKVALAAVLALNPEVLILDEPLASLDRRSQTCLIELFHELKQAGKTLIIATHEEAIKQLGDNVLQMN